jgi:hypothetical protein
MAHKRYADVLIYQQCKGVRAGGTFPIIVFNVVIEKVYMIVLWWGSQAGMLVLL